VSSILDDPEVRFLVGGGLWAVVGLWLMTWWDEANEKWRHELTRIGLMPEGADAHGFIVRHPIRAFKRDLAYHAAALPHAVRTTDPEVEIWSIRRSRRRRLFVGWAFCGWPVAFLVTYTLDAAQEDVRWALALLPIAAGLVFGLRRAHEYGNATYEMGISGPDA
jgi:hypothetical protein